VAVVVVVTVPVAGAFNTPIIQRPKQQRRCI